MTSTEEGRFVEIAQVAGVLSTVSVGNWDIDLPPSVKDAWYGLHDWAHNMNKLQASALVGTIGATAVIGFTAIAAWRHWHQPRA